MTVALNMPYRLHEMQAASLGQRFVMYSRSSSVGMISSIRTATASCSSTLFLASRPTIASSMSWDSQKNKRPEIRTMKVLNMDASNLAETYSDLAMLCHFVRNAIH